MHLSITIKAISITKLEVNNVEKQVALIIGGGSGIGKATAFQLAQLGFYVVIADRNEEALCETLLEMQLFSEDVQMKMVDIIEEEQVIELFNQWPAPLSRLDVLVNCAGVSNPKPLLETNTGLWDLIMDVNLRGTYLLCKYAFPFLKQSEGMVINVASIMGTCVYPNNAAYSASKAAVIHLTKTLAAEWLEYKVRVNAVAPAKVDTPLLRKLSRGTAEDIEREIMAGIEANRIQTSEQIAGVISLLLRSEAKILNGICLIADGGSQLR
jgi:NAD(P)-dependent dehydrogenase (short-subunit alcohol dehydrogenase family)